MAKSSVHEKLAQFPSSENETGEDELEALSLCDLPINEDDRSTNVQQEDQSVNTTVEEFDFASTGASAFTPFQMCAADEVFFRGQILPFRHSVSSDRGLTMFRMSTSRDPTGCLSRSESMDHRCCSAGFRSTTVSSSRSSSIRSHHSSSSGSSTTQQKERVRNQFHSHPSPTPQIRIPSALYGNVNQHHRNRKSGMWSIFRVGLVRTPGIELQDLKKVRSSNGHDHHVKSFGGSRSSSTSSGSSSNNEIKKKKKQRFFFDINAALFGAGGCKSSVNAVVTVPSRVVTVKGGYSNLKEASHDEEEVVMKKTKQKQKQQPPEQEQQPPEEEEEEEGVQGKHAMSRHRTFEWLKELSLAGVPDGGIG